MSDKQIDAQADKLLLELSKRGQVVEGGWMAYVILSLSGCSELQKSEMRKAYFFGAQHVFASIMRLLEPGTEPTDNDLKVVGDIHDELAKFVEEIKAQPNQ